MSTKVLIAHGNTQRLKRAVAELQARGFEVAAIPDGGDAFARFFEEAPDLVICSEILPGLSGVNFARMVRSQAPDTPVIILVDGDASPETKEFDVRSDPLSVDILYASYPELIPETPASAVSPSKAASTVEVFTLSALKRFQRGSHPLALLDESGVSAMARVAEKHACSDGEIVIRQGDIGDSCYLVLEGQVRVTLREQADAEVARIGEGGFFGEMALLSDQPRSASVWAVGNTTLLRFSRSQFLPILESYPSLREMLSGVAIERSEENLWSVLLADDEVQESLAGLEDEDEVTLSPVDLSAETDPTSSSNVSEAALGARAAVEVTRVAAVAPASAAAVSVETIAPPSAAASSPSSPVAAAPRLELGDLFAPETELTSLATETQAPAASEPTLEQIPALRASARPPSGWRAIQQAPRQALALVGLVGLAVGAVLAVVVVLAVGGGGNNAPMPAPQALAAAHNVEGEAATPSTVTPPTATASTAPTATPAPSAGAAAPAVTPTPPAESATPAASTAPVAIAPVVSASSAIATATAPPTSPSSVAVPQVIPVKPQGGVVIEPPSKPQTPSSVAPLPKLSDAERRDLRKQFFVRYRARDYADALALGHKLRAAVPADWEVAINVADTERNLGDFDDALTSYLSFIDKFPSNIYIDDAHFWAADILIARGKKAEAKALLQKVLSNPKTHYRAGAEERLKKL